MATPTGAARRAEPYAARPFRPARWLPGPHAQTIVGRLVGGVPRVATDPGVVVAPDGQRIAIEVVRLADRPANDAAPRILVLHGLEGSTDSGYVRESFRRLAGHGMIGVGLNFRSCGPEPVTTARLYHAGDTDDLAAVVDQVAADAPAAPLGAIGSSLGGNVLLKYLGERGDACRLRAAVAISVPFDLAAGARAIERGVARLYARRFLRSLLAKAGSHAARVGSAFDLERGLRARTLWEFDDAVTAPLHGFGRAEQYYHESSSARFLHAIRRPTLLIQALDDPFLPEHAIPRAEMEANPCLTSLISDRGGHVGFVEGPPWRPRRWAEAEATRFLDHYLTP